MDHRGIIRKLSDNRETFRSLFSGIKEEQQHWRPAAGKWNLLEVLCHLYDEEREDFRARLKHTLEAPALPLPAIDPQGWVNERNYSGKNFEEMLSLFLREREESVKWLNSLLDPSWNNVHIHPKFGEMSAEMFLANWLAHDFLHLRQILKLNYEYLRAKSEVRFDYAGDW